MPDEPPGPEIALLRPLGERLADSRRAEFGADEDVPAGVHSRIAEIVGHWKSLRPAPGLLPGRGHFDPLQVPQLLKNIWLVDVVKDDPRLFRARLVGTAFGQVGARLRAGKFFEDVAPEAEAKITAAPFRRVLATGRIDWRRGPSSLSHMEHVRELERVILPLAGDGAEVDMFLCLTVFYMSDGGAI
ncbi:PAS domain-containing protein [Desertibaculum subflavum]|uniref:PAS domain-containing protein n=1 Tax=Desertibaculum subflavum TaxID=2268458 RepID=UPI000E6764E9